MRRSQKPTIRRAFVYCRVSTATQAAEGISLDAQRTRAEAHATAAGLELGGVYVDAGLSGRRADKRPELQRALDAVCANGGVLIVYSLSRLARSTRDTLDIAERLHRAGADLVSLSESIDTTSAAGKMLFRLLAVLAEFEADLASERTSAALDSRRRRRLKTGGSVPYGFDAAESGALSPNTSEQAVLARIRSLRSEGATIVSIVATLNRERVPARGARWHATTVSNILARDGAPFREAVA